MSNRITFALAGRGVDTFGIVCGDHIVSGELLQLRESRESAGSG